jgi:imidazolonepropionase-like amidohydrolase
VGTDSGIGQTQPGESIAEELRLLVSAGLSPFEALRGATSLAAEYLHLENDVGVIKAGARADLLVLDANPLRDVAAVRRIHLVTLRGQIFDHE